MQMMTWVKTNSDSATGVSTGVTTFENKWTVALIEAVHILQSTKSVLRYPPWKNSRSGAQRHIFTNVWGNIVCNSKNRKQLNVNKRISQLCYSCTMDCSPPNQD